MKCECDQICSHYNVSNGRQIAFLKRINVLDLFNLDNLREHRRL